MALVPPPPATVPPHSLVRAADTTRDADPDWEKGLQYLPEAPGGYRVAGYCGAPADEVDHTRPLPAAVDYMPFEVRFFDPCETTFGYRDAEVTDRLRRISDATESYAIAHEMWTGEAATANAEPNVYLRKAGAVTVLNGGAAVSPKRGLGLLEEAVGDALMGQQGFLHLAREVRPYVWELEKVGNLLFTKLDNAVVCDAGYDGTAPEGQAAAANVAWVYATGPVVVRRSPLAFYAAADAEVIDTATNTRVRTASKLAAATFDPATLFAVPITLD